MSNRNDAVLPGPMPRRSLRWWAVGLSKSACALLLVYAPLGWFAANYRVAFDPTPGARCLPFRVFLVDIKDRALKRGDYVAFVAEQMEPFYKNGTLAVKMLSGVPGDLIQVDTRGTWVNGQYRGALLHVKPGERLYRMGRRESEYLRAERVPEQRLWVLGTHPRSYDSRYWGYVTNEQVVGRAIALW